MNRATALRRWELWTLVSILLLAALLRLVALVDVPPGLRYDELLNLRMAERVLAGDCPLYFTESWGHEPLFHYAQAAVIALTRKCDWSLRLPAVAFGLLGVLTTWLAARRLFGARVAILAAAALTVSFWSIFYSREGSRVIAVTPFFPLMVYFVCRGLDRSSARRWQGIVDSVAGGLCMGSMVYFYVAGRVPPLLLVAFALYLLLFHRPQFKRVWPGLLLSGVVGMILAAPLLLLLYQNPGMEQRIDQLGDAWTVLRAGNPLPVFFLALQACGMFVWRGEEDWLYNVYGRPVFDVLAAACFILGVLVCIWRWRHARCALLLLWLMVGISPAIVVPPAASLTHTIAAQPPAYILVAVGIEALWRAASERWKWVGPWLAVGIVAFHGAASYRAYFVTWAGAPEVRELYQGGITAVAHELDAHHPPGPVAVGAPYVSYWHPWNAVAFDLALRRDDLDVRWFNPAGGWIWPAGEGPITYYFPADPLGPQGFDPVLENLFFLDATSLSSGNDDFSVFRVSRPAALEGRLDTLVEAPVTWPPELAHPPSPGLPLTFGDRFALLGAELQEDTVQPSGELRLITYWVVLAVDSAPVSEPVVAFVHLTSDGQDIWGQQDWLDVRTAGLQPGDRFAQVHSLLVGPETPPGLYHVQLGLYGPDTLVRLPITSGAGGTADRVWVAEARVTE
jgi:4-amino-4-deoxy-L-arabinose transferase-like glycosyltransferase